MKKTIAVLLLVLMYFQGSISPAEAEESIVAIDLSESTIKVTGNEGEVSTTIPDEHSDFIQIDELSAVSVGEIDKSSLQLLVQIETAESPLEYHFALPQVKDLVTRKIGAYEVYELKSDLGETIGWLGSAWAKDSNGQDVPSKYIFSNGVLTQQVLHHDGNFSYPIVADPYLGIKLINSVTAVLEKPSGKYRLSVSVSAWVWAQYAAMTVSLAWGYTAAYIIVTTYGWPEVLSLVSTRYGPPFRGYVVSNGTYQNQFDCHAMGAPLLFIGYFTGYDSRPTWDLEGYRRIEENPITWAVTSCSW